MKQLLLLSCLLLFVLAASAQDTTKVWNGIWDPSDPLCPCHDEQKKADAEYKKMLEEEAKQNTNKNLTDGGQPPPQDNLGNNPGNNDNNNNDFQVNASVQVQLQVQDNVGNEPNGFQQAKTSNLSVSQGIQASVQAGANTRVGGGSNYSPGIKARTGGMKYRHFKSKVGKKIKKAFHHHKKKGKIQLDECWHA